MKFRGEVTNLEKELTIDGSIFQVMYDLERNEPVNVDVAIADDYQPLSKQSKELQDKIMKSLKASLEE